MSTSERITSLRNAMKKASVAAYIIPSSDPHQSEYVPDHWKSRAWITGFTGSAGTFALTFSDAGLWTDSRYFIQGEAQLAGTAITLHKVYNQGSPQYIDWLIENLPAGASIGCDGTLFSKNQISGFEKKLKVKNIHLITDLDLISDIWTDRPTLPPETIMRLSTDLTGQDCTSKIDNIREVMTGQGASFHLVSTLDDIAWIFNIRGSDVSYNPVAVSYALIGEKDATLYINPSKVGKDLRKTFNAENIIIKPYDAIWEDLNNLEETESILIDENTISHQLYRAINCQKVNHLLPSITLKAIKNETEIRHFRNAMIKDGVALTKFYMWLEKHINNNLKEYDLVEKIQYFRSMQKDYVSESFGAIVGYKSNGAIVHYSPDPEHSAVIKPEGILLIDSGGQYMDGTTDITRTISLNTPSKEEKDAYTRVLKGNIALDTVIFPEGTLGVQLDTLARVPLWGNKMNFLHGTGHGVGFFLNVHEGPQGFHPGIAARSKNAIKEHMVTTNEPGYYATGKFGIRIENCLLTVKVGESESGPFYGFETLTMFPIDTELIDLTMMDRKEIQWLNDYHKIVYARLSPMLNEEEKVWLAQKCAAISS